MADIKQTIAQRAALELKDGQIINLGIGVPTFVANYTPPGVDVVIHSENGAVSVGPAPLPSPCSAAEATSIPPRRSR
jgi:acyl CoA:acetate/3-ketoacid CoA transferase beta subunit